MTKEEELALRELAAGRCAIQSVIAQLGPMSLWSKDGLEREIQKAVLAEREACAKLCEEPGWNAANWCAKKIRERNN